MTLPLPARLAGYTVEGEWSNDYAGTTVRRLVQPGEPTVFLKTGPSLGGEAARLRWAHQRIAAPAVVDFTAGATDALLTAGIAGTPASERDQLPDTAAVVDAVARALRNLHRLPVQDCPFDTSTDALLTAAERGLDSTYEVWDETARCSRPARDVFDELVATRPPPTPQAVLHGDASLPNFLIHGTKVVGLIDLGFLGVGDPWWDIATCLKSIDRPSNAIADQRHRSLASYGIAADEARERWFRLLYAMDTHLDH